MRKHRPNWIAAIALAAAVGVDAPSHAVTGTVRVTVAKAGFIVAVGGGKGILTFATATTPSRCRA